MINLFVRQPFTEAGEVERQITQEVIDHLHAMDNDPYPLVLVTGNEAQSAVSFKESYTRVTGQPFTPQGFRKYRLQLLDTADAFINIRTGLSESSTFEIAYNIFKGKNIPIFFAIWNKAPMKTTLLQDLGDLCNVRYSHFNHASDLIVPIKEFLSNIPVAVPADCRKIS